MEEEKKEEALELEIDSNPANGIVAIKNFETALAITKMILDEYQPFEIKNEDEKKNAKMLRARFNSMVKQIDRNRIDTLNEFTGSFVDKCNQLSVPLKERANEFGERIKAYENKMGKPEEIVCTLKFYEPKVLNKLKDFCAKYSISITVK